MFSINSLNFIFELLNKKILGGKVLQLCSLSTFSPEENQRDWSEKLIKKKMKNKPLSSLWNLGMDLHEILLSCEVKWCIPSLPLTYNQVLVKLPQTVYLHDGQTTGIRFLIPPQNTIEFTVFFPCAPSLCNK